MSACFLQGRTSKEIIRFHDKVNNNELVKVLVLYPHTIGEKVLWCLSDSLQRTILENMHQYVRTNAFSLSECVDAEKVVQDVLECLWSDRFNEYNEMKEMEELIAHRIGKKEYQSENLLAVNKLFQIGLISVDDWITTCKKVNQYFNDKQIKRLKNQHYCIYLRYQNTSNKKLYEMLDHLEDRYCQDFPYLNKGGFVESGSMYLILKYYNTWEE